MLAVHSAPLVAGAYESYESCGLTVPAKLSMHGGFFAARITSADTLLSFSGADGQPPNDVKVPSFDKDKGDLISASVRLQVAVSVKADCGPYGIMYDRPDFKAKNGANDHKWPYESKCWKGDGECEKGSYENYPCDSANCDFVEGDGHGQGGSGNFEKSDSSEASTVYYPWKDHCSVAVIRAQTTNMVLVNGFQVGVIHKGRSADDAWTDCSAKRMNKNDYDHLRDTSLGDDIRFCGTDKLNNASGIPMGKDAIDYEWTSMVQDFSFAPLETGKPKIATLLNHDGMETISWKTRDDFGHEPDKAMPGLGPPLRVVMQGPVQELDAEFWGRYCMHYVYNSTESDDDSDGQNAQHSEGEDGAAEGEASAQDVKVTTEAEADASEAVEVEAAQAQDGEDKSGDEEDNAVASGGEAGGSGGESDSDPNRGPKSNWVTTQLVHGCHECCCHPASGTPRGIYYYGGCPEHLMWRSIMESEADTDLEASDAKDAAVARRQLKDKFYLHPGVDSATGEIASEECPFSPNYINFTLSGQMGFQDSWSVNSGRDGLNACCAGAPVAPTPAPQ